MLSVQCLPVQCRCKFSEENFQISMRPMVLRFLFALYFCVVLFNGVGISGCETMPVPPQVQKFIGDVDKALHEPGKFTDTLGQVEAKTNVKRIYTVGGTFRRSTV